MLTLKYEIHSAVDEIRRSNYFCHSLISMKVPNFKDNERKRNNVVLEVKNNSEETNII